MVQKITIRFDVSELINFVFPVEIEVFPNLTCRIRDNSSHVFPRASRSQKLRLESKCLGRYRAGRVCFQKTEKLPADPLEHMFHRSLTQPLFCVEWPTGRHHSSTRSFIISLCKPQQTEI